MGVEDVLKLPRLVVITSRIRFIKKTNTLFVQTFFITQAPLNA